MSKGFKILLAVIDIMIAIASFVIGGTGIIGGFLMLGAAFLVSPLPQKIPSIVSVKTGLFSILAFLVGFIFMVIGATGNQTQESSAPDSQPTDTRETTTQAQTDITTTVPVVESTTEPIVTTTTLNTTTTENTETESHSEELSATLGELNALKAAQSYIDLMAFSYSGLIEQLEYSKYTHDEAVYAADHCDVDWNEEALEAAEDYIDTMAFSYKDLLGQLDYSGFTKEQAAYGADNCGADWNEEAAEAAQSYLDTMAMSREELQDQLKYAGFTDAQVQYGLSSVGY